jgi:hypothetical protein
MNRDLFLAILSMDTYNRGYGVGINNLPESGQLGNATLLAATSAQKAGWETAGFYAIAYDMTGVAGFAAGERVISYRGSDEGRVQDILLGYPTAVGFPSVQGTLALAFARSVIGGETLPSAAQNVVVTGHSLGAGLAGFVCGIFGQEAVLFDPMPYCEAVRKAQEDLIASGGSPALRSKAINDNPLMLMSRIA